MASVCIRCGNKISLFKRFSGTNLCPDCERKSQEERHDALTKTQNVLKSIWNGELPLEQGRSDLESLSNANYLSLKEQEKFAKEREIVAKQAFREFAAEVLKDDILSVSEEEHLFDIAKIVGINQSSLQTDFRDIFSRLIVARVNDGRLPVLDNAKIMLKANEVAHSSRGIHRSKLPCSQRCSVQYRQY